MCGVGLLHVPAEVIQHIGVNLLPQDVKSLRLVCSWLSLCMEPIALSCVTLDIFNHTPTTTIHKLEALANRRSRVSKFARTVKIKSLVPRHDLTMSEYCVRFLMWEPSTDTVEACMRTHLAAAISSLENVGSIIWTMNEYDPEWAQQPVSEAITGLRFLRSFKLILPKSVHLSTMNGLRFGQLCHLEKISVFGACDKYHYLIVPEAAEAIANSPLLAHLEIDYPLGNPPPLDDFLVKRSPEMPLSFSRVAFGDVQYYFRVTPHLHALRSLELTNTSFYFDPLKCLPESRTLMTKIYQTLADEHILLSRIVVDNVFPAFLDYLSSYSGILTEISILNLYKPVPWEELDDLATRFYTSILPKLVGSLEILNISPMFICKWCFHPKAYSLFAQAKHLRSLNVTFVFAHSSVADPNLDYTLDDSVSSIMRLPSTLHFLTNIKITVAMPREWRGHRWHPSHVADEDFSEKLDEFAHTIRIGINNFAFTRGEEPSSRSRPLIEVEGSPPSWWQENWGFRALLRMDG